MAQANGSALCFVKTDNEFATNRFKEFCEEKGIIHEKTAPYSSYQNGGAESTIGHIKRKMRTLVVESGIPKFLWEYCFLHVVFLLNRTVREGELECPMTKMTGKEVIEEHIMPFGCQAFAYHYNRDQKLYNVSISGIFLGYDDSLKIAKIYVPNKRRIFSTSAWKCIEDKFPLRDHWLDVSSTDKIQGDKIVELDYNEENEKTNTNNTYGGDTTFGYSGSSSHNVTKSSNYTGPTPASRMNTNVLQNSLNNSKSKMDKRITPRHRNRDDEMEIDQIPLVREKHKRNEDEMEVDNTPIVNNNDISQEIFPMQTQMQYKQYNSQVPIHETQNNQQHIKRQATVENVIDEEFINYDNDLPTDIDMPDYDSTPIFTERSAILHEEAVQRLMKEKQVQELQAKLREKEKKKLQRIKERNARKQKWLENRQRKMLEHTKELQSKSKDSNIEQLNNPRNQKDKITETTPYLVEEPEDEDDERQVPTEQLQITDGTENINPSRDESRSLVLANNRQLEITANRALIKYKRKRDNFKNNDRQIIRYNQLQGSKHNNKQLVKRSHPTSRIMEKRIIERNRRTQELNEIIARKNQDSIRSGGDKMQVDSDFETYLLVDKTKYSIPVTFKDVLKSQQKQQWFDAIKEELKSINNEKVFTIMKRKQVPKTALLVRARWVFNVKKEINGSDRFKARLVAKGFTQERGENYVEKFAPVVKDDTMRVMLAIAVIKKWYIKQLDAKNAFLNGVIDYDTYMVPPEGTDTNKDCVWKLNKGLYGLKQAPLLWFKTLSKVLTSAGYKASIIEPCLFYTNDKKCMILIYVDDIIIIAENQKLINRATQALNSSFTMKDLGQPEMFLGIDMSRKDNTLKLNMKSTINRIKKNFEIESHKSKINTPLAKGFESNGNLKSKNLNPSEHHEYRSIIGAILYIARMARPDISFAVSFLSKYLSTPTQAHLKAAQRVLQYLIQTSNNGIKYSKKGLDVKFKDFRYVDKTNDVTLKDYDERTEFRITVITDASWGNHIEDRRSQAGYIVLLNNNIVAWNSKRLKTVADSSSEAEYMAITEGIKEGIFIKNILQNMGFKIGYINLCCDNMAALTLSSHNTLHQRTKHIDIRYHKIRQYVDNKDIKLNYINTKDNIADLMTKSFDTTRYNELLNLIEMKYN